jgi:hypothetical protein
MAEYDEFCTVLAMRASLAFDSPLWGELPAPTQLPGESNEDFAKRVDAAAASKKRASKLFVLPKGTFVLQCVVAYDPPFEGGAVVLATTQDDVDPASVVKVEGEVATIVPAVGSDTALWLRRDGEPTKGRVEVVIAYVKATPAAVAALPATEYPKWIGAGHDGKVVNSKAEEDALAGEPPKTLSVAPTVAAPPPSGLPGGPIGG